MCRFSVNRILPLQGGILLEGLFSIGRIDIWAMESLYDRSPGLQTKGKCHRRNSLSPLIILKTVGSIASVIKVSLAETENDSMYGRMQRSSITIRQYLKNNHRGYITNRISKIRSVNKRFLAWRRIRLDNFRCEGRNSL